MNAASRAIMVAGGVGSAAIAFLQPVIYLGGPVAYRAFGAPPSIAEMRLAEPGRMALWSTFWFCLFVTFAVYAFSAAGLVRRAPLLKPALVTIAVIFAIRGLAIVPQVVWFDEFAVTRSRDVAFSAFAILLAVSYATAAGVANAATAAPPGPR